MVSVPNPGDVNGGPNDSTYASQQPVGVAPGKLTGEKLLAMMKAHKIACSAAVWADYCGGKAGPVRSHLQRLRREGLVKVEGRSKSAKWRAK